MFRTSITITHNMEMAHRLSLTPGKCEHIHGHSWLVHLTLFGSVDDAGLLEGIDFGDAKRVFRRHLDTAYDHRLILNQNDPLVVAIANADLTYPGLRRMDGDPTTENVAMAISAWAGAEYGLPNEVVVHETEVNAATASSDPHHSVP